MSPSLRKELEKHLEDYMAGKFDEPLEGLNTLLEEEKLSDDEILYAKMFKSEMIGYTAFHDYEGRSLQDAFELAQEVVDKLDETEDEYLKVGALMNLGGCNFLMNNWSEFLEIYSQYIDDFHNLKPIKEYYYLKLKAGNYVYTYLEPYIRAFTGEAVSDEEKNQLIQVIMESLRYSRENNLKIYQGMNLNNLSSMYYWKGDLEGFLNTRKELFELIKSMDNKRTYAYGLGMMASTYQSFNDFKKSFE